MKRLTEPLYALDPHAEPDAETAFLGLEEHCGIPVTQEIRCQIARELFLEYDPDSNTLNGVPLPKPTHPEDNEASRLHGWFPINEKLQSREQLLEHIRVITASECRIVFWHEEQKKSELPPDLKLIVTTNNSYDVNIKPDISKRTHARGAELLSPGSSEGGSRGFRIEVA